MLLDSQVSDTGSNMVQKQVKRELKTVNRFDFIESVNERK